MFAGTPSLVIKRDIRERNKRKSEIGIEKKSTGNERPRERKRVGSVRDCTGLRPYNRQARPPPANIDMIEKGKTGGM